jgi:hypothetical protein
MTTTEQKLAEGEAADLKAKLSTPEAPAATLVPNNVIEGEVIDEPAAKPMSKTAATKLDRRIKAAAKTADGALVALRELLAEAQAGSIHLALGLRSWAEYMETISLPALGKQATRDAIELLSDAGMSSRGIAKVTGVPATTVRREAKKAAEKAEKAGAPKAPAKSTGKDGKEYVRTTPARKQGAAKAAAKKAEGKAERVSVKGKPPTMRAIRLGEVAHDLETVHYSKFLEGEINNIRRIAKAAAMVISAWDNNAANNRTAKA